MSYPVILCDVDGVLADFVGGICKIVEEGGWILKPDDIHHLDLSKSMTVDQFRRVERYAHQSGFCAHLNWYSGAAKMVHELDHIGSVFAVTAPWKCHTWCAERIQWLTNFIHKDKVIFTSAKYMVRGDVLIEDNPSHLQQWMQVNPNALGILIDRPWNRSVSATSIGAVRVEGNYEALGMIRDLYK